MNMFHFFSRGLVLASLCAVAQAADVAPSCYNAKLPAPNQVLDKELFVVIDQTTLLDDALKQGVANQVRSFVVPGQGVTVLVFSAYTQASYTQLLVSTPMDHLLPKSQRADISKPLLASFDRCIARQPTATTRILGTVLRAAFDGSTDKITKSDVMGSMKGISRIVRESTAQEKVVLVVSDMLENSSVTSFYAKQVVRKIDPEAEIKLAQDNQLIGDFGGTRVYVLGAGLLNSTPQKNNMAYRDLQTMQALSSFWGAYFKLSNAQLVEFGQPALLNPVQ